MLSKSARCIFVLAALSPLSTVTIAQETLSSIKALDGNWVHPAELAVDNNCPAGEFMIETFVIKDGHATGVVGHSQDGPFRFSANIQKDGTVSYYAQGQYVMIKGEGHFTDNRGTGRFEVTGETNCDGAWDLVKQ